MRAYCYPSDSWGVGHYRMVWPAEAARQAGLDVVVCPPGGRTGLSSLTLGGTSAYAAPEDADAVVLQRVTARALADAILPLQRRGVAVVVDVDDDLTCIDPSNPNFAGLHPRRSPDNNWNQLVRACRDATLVTCSTPALLERFAPHGRGLVLENRVPARYLDVKHVDEGGDDPLFGWAGSLGSHPHDLPVTGGGLAKAHPRFKVVGDPAGVGEQLGLGCVGGTGDVELRDWPEAVSALHIGIAPLAYTKFNRAKSWLKPLEYAAVGVPWIGSPTPEYEKFGVLTGSGLTVLRPKDWSRAARWLKEPFFRAETSACGRERVRESHLYEGAGHLWAEAWTAAVEGLRR